MSIELDRAGEVLGKLQPEARELWLEIGGRLVEGQERYGGFKFGDYDLTKMKREEIEDWIVYLFAERQLLRKGEKNVESGNG